MYVYTCFCLPIYFDLQQYRHSVLHLALTPSHYASLLLPVYVYTCIHDHEMLYPIPRPDFDKKLGAGAWLQGLVYLGPGRHSSA